jgi:hypothetical protein
MANDIKELELIKANMYLGIEENHNTAHKDEKEKLEKEYVKKITTDSKHRAKHNK